MSEVRFTKEQTDAITARGGALLVSAAAGSGKTAVLVERLMRRITDPESPVNIDRFLIVTYTNAAAAEMRGKISAALAQRLAENPADRNLRRQMDRLGLTQIETVHAFCMRLIRENAAHLPELGAQFRLADDTEARLLLEAALEEVLEEKYETVETDAPFSALVDTLAGERDDRALTETILTSYALLQSHAYPMRWLNARMRDYVPGTPVAETAWGAYILDTARAVTESVRERLSRALASLRALPELERAYGPAFSDDLEKIETLCAALAARRWNEAYAALRACLSFARLGQARGFEDKALMARFKAVRDGVKDALKSMGEKLICGDEETLSGDIARSEGVARGLTDVLAALDTAYAVKKRARRLLDFSDLEHFALQLLVDEDSGEDTALARECAAQFEEIMVDEYQDTNEIQDRIFGAVSGGGARLFMVGDVKQSIYRFRLADPGIFLSKYATYRDYDAACPGGASKVILSKNFRSRGQVLAFANHIFSRVMTRQLGDLDYGEREALYPGASYDGDAAAYAPELMLCAYDKDDESGEGRAAFEARMTAGRIRALLDSGMEVTDADTGQRRRVEPRDIVILLRSMAGRGALYENALADVGVDASSGTGGGFFGSAEAGAMLSLLAAVDNPRQDVMLIGALRSPLFAFTAEELARVRVLGGAGDFYTALTAAAGADDAGVSRKCADFLALLSEFRRASADMSVSRLLWHIYNRTGALGIFGAMRGGARRAANLIALFDCARSFETLSFRGLFAFLKYLERRQADGADIAPASADGTKGVRIMTIHKSKGLEFPVVFLCDCAKQFNRSDQMRPVQFHPKLGLGVKLRDERLKIRYPTFMYTAIVRKMRDESLSEEMRVLYVALTRAKEKLVLSVCPPKLERAVERWRMLAADSALDPQELLSEQSGAAWLVCPLLCHPSMQGVLPGTGPAVEEEVCDFPLDVRVMEDMPQQNEKTAPETGAAARVSIPADFEQVLRWRYPHAAATQLPSKATPTVEAALGPQAYTPVPVRRPSFDIRARGLTSAERGTAHHVAMQFVDYRKCTTRAGVEEELRRLQARAILTKEQAQAVDAAKLLAFFESPLGRRVLAAQRILREYKFSVIVRADELEAQTPCPEETRLLQGVVDCAFWEGERLFILDFKTDRVREEEAHARAARYAPQLAAYALALEKVTGVRAAARYLYFIECGRTVSLDSASDA